MRPLTKNFRYLAPRPVHYPCYSPHVPQDAPGLGRMVVGDSGFLLAVTGRDDYSRLDAMVDDQRWDTITQWIYGDLTGRGVST